MGVADLGRVMRGNLWAEATCSKWRHGSCKGLGQEYSRQRQQQTQRWEWVWSVYGAVRRSAWLEAWVEDSILGLSGTHGPTLPFSKVKLDRSQSDWRQPRGGMLTHIFLVNCSFGVRLIWLKGKGELEVLPLHLKGWFHRRGHSFGGCGLPTIPGAGCGDSLDACPAGHVELSLLPGQSRVPKYQKH